MENTENLSAVISIINECLLTDGYFKYSKLVDNLELISKIGTIVKSFTGIFGVEGVIIREENNEPPNEPMILETLHELEIGMENKIAQKMSNLTKLMLDTMKFHNLQSFENLRQAHVFQGTSPLHCTVNFTTFVEDNSTNPLICAMNSDKLKTKETFEKWKTFIDAVLSQFLFLEAYCGGMFLENTYNVNILKQKIEILNAQINQLEKDYRRDGSYWEHIEQLVYDTQDHNVHLGNIPKSNILQDTLSSVLTDDSFFVLVYDHCEKPHRHVYRYNKGQAVISFNRGNCNVAVYRSRHWNETSENEKKELKREVESLQKNRVPWSNNYHEHLEFIDGIVIHNAGFLAMVRKDRDIAIRAINCESGPGAYTTVTAGNNSQNSVFILFAGFN